MALGVYIHIPFCKQKCAYCDFYSIAGDEKLMDAYCSALEQQMGDYFRKGNTYEVDTIYIGGGTPSVLGAKRLTQLLRELEKRVKLSRNPEITVEVNPESCDKALFKALKKAGVNRISMGVQSADEGELHALGRIHSFETARQAAELCRLWCTDNLSVDLMYGLPGQDAQKVRASLEQLLTLQPRHISCYALKVEEGTPLAKANPTLPDDDSQADMYLMLVNQLAKAGYVQYEISNFAKDGCVSRHNSKYWDLSEYLGLGCAAHSFFEGRRFSFVRDVRTYIQGFQGKAAIVEDMDDTVVANRSGEYVMLKLRTAAGIDEECFYRRFHLDFQPYAARLEKYVPDGYVRHDSGCWRLTPKGFLVSNRIIGDALEAADQISHY